LRATAARCFEHWEGLIAAHLRAEDWPEPAVAETASAALALIEGALLLSRVSGDPSHLANAKRAAASLLAPPGAKTI
jgi:TetR/AcrR family transcriptional repressor of lmrAB and yxaGH operons